MRVNAGVNLISRFAILGNEESIEGVVVDKEQLHEAGCGEIRIQFSPI